MPSHHQMLELEPALHEADDKPQAEPAEDDNEDNGQRGDAVPVVIIYPVFVAVVT